MRKTDHIDPIDEILNSPTIDGAKAHFSRPEEAARLASKYVEGLNSVTAELREASAHAASNPDYLGTVVTKEHRDCFLLCLSPDSCAFPVNQIQARLELEGKRKTVYALARETLLKAQQDFRTALTNFKDQVSSYREAPC